MSETKPEIDNEASVAVAGPALETDAPLKVEAEAEIEIEFTPTEDELGRTYATGKRKNAIARVWIKPGSGEITVNTKPGNKYFRRVVLGKIINHPFETAECVNRFDAMCTVKGGGLSGQAGALRHGISKALALRSLEMRKKLKAQGFLTRDSRVVERKKYGRKKARRSFQFSKR